MTYKTIKIIIKMSQQQTFRRMSIKRTANENHLAWQELIKEDETSKIRSISKCLQHGILAKIEQPETLLLNYQRNSRFKSNMRDYSIPNSKIHSSIFGSSPTNVNPILNPTPPILRVSPQKNEEITIHPIGFNQQERRGKRIFQGDFCLRIFFYIFIQNSIYES